MEYTLIKSKRKTLSVMVKDAKVIVRAPLGTSDERIEAFLRSHQNWIMKYVEEQKNMVQADFSDGSTIELFGKKRIIGTGRAMITDEKVYIPAEKRDEALIRLLREHAREHMTAITEELARAYGFQFQRITITSARGRWGSCSWKGDISYTFRTAFLPLELAYYLAAHELVHTRYMDHSTAFWAELKKIFPDCIERRRRLKEYVWALKCL